MNNRRKASSICKSIVPAALILALSSSRAHAHNQPAHMAITESAALSSQGLPAFLQESLGAEQAPFTDLPKLVAHPPPDDHFLADGYAPVSWLMFGSDHEDRNFRRSCNHFYTLVPQRQAGQVAGLTDNTEPALA